MNFSIKTLLAKNKTIFANFSYITILQVAFLLIPLVTYPYLIRVLGKDLYGVVITAQVLVSYASLVIDFGTNSICAKYISIHRDNKEQLSEIVCSVLTIRTVLAVLCFFIYLAVISLVPLYREYFTLFLLSYTLVLGDILFSQFYFQGIENMKYITIISLIFKFICLVLIFVVIKKPEHYIYVPILYFIGHFISGFFSGYIIFVKDGLRLYRPKYASMKKYLKESVLLFSTDLISTIKDKFSYFMIGSFVGIGDVVVYDLAVKLNGIITKPVNILGTVLFPRFAQNRNVQMVKKIAIAAFLVTTFIVVVSNIFLPEIAFFFLNEEIDLWPIRLFFLAPIFLSVSYILASNFFIAFGYNKYMLYSIIVTTVIYLVGLGVVFFTNSLSSLYAYIIIGLLAYFSELIYRMYAMRKLTAKP